MPSSTRTVALSVKPLPLTSSEYSPAARAPSRIGTPPRPFRTHSPPSATTLPVLSATETATRLVTGLLPSKSANETVSTPLARSVRGAVTT